MYEVAYILYMLAVALFIFGLKMLSSPATARRGNMVAASGMAIAILTTLMVVITNNPISLIWIIIAFAVGGAIGGFAAKMVAMTEMPEMVALFNGFGGIASLIVGLAEFHKLAGGYTFPLYDAVVIMFAILIGGITFTGSLIAWGKLSGTMDQKAVVLPGQNIISLATLAGALVCAVIFCISPASGISWLWVYFVVVIAMFLGVLATNAIGGGDMPVVISLMNSYSGMAASAAGFVVNNMMLIVSGALVGSSGIILTVIMCKAMNRSLTNVLFSAFGSEEQAAGAGGPQGEVKPLSPQDAYYILEAAQSVVFVPGYGMAVAQAQHVVRELADILKENGAEVYYAVHPVAGRMPGHMNVLLAEANVPYDELLEMEDINPKMGEMDVAIVIGANDVVNPAARHDESSPIYGMPIIDVDKARTSFVLKRSMAAGFAGVQNELFFYPNNRMIFGDAKETLNAIIGEFDD